ncbi:glycine cleavage system protein H, partial [candidate division TA06 bacterium DG_78]
TDLYGAVSGEVTEVNDKVIADPSIINKDPYGEGWLYKVKVADPKEYENLLSPDQYKELIAKH